MAVLSTRGPMAVYQARSNRMARPPDFATNCIFAIIPHDQFISGRAKLFLAKASPMAVFARPNGRFINAEATGMPDLQISATNCIFAIISHDQFISGRDKLFSAKAVPMAVLSTQGPMAALARQKQHLQISTTNCTFAIIPHDQFITGKLFLAKAGPMAVLSTRGPMVVLSTRFIKSNDRIASSILSRAISLSAAGPSHFQRKQAQWPFIKAADVSLRKAAR